MKNRYFLSVLAAGWLGLLSACNGDVFIDDFAPDADYIKMASDGHTETIGFKSDNWDLYSVYTVTGDELKGSVYDAQGQLLGDDMFSVSPGWTKFVSNHPTVAFTVERTKGDALSVTVSENASGQPFPFFISVGNDYETRTLNLVAQPSEVYQLDSIVYTMGSCLWQDSIARTPQSVQWNNTGPEAVTLYVYPYRDNPYQYRFTCYDDATFALLGSEPPQVPVPDADEIDWLYMSDRQIPLDLDVHLLPAPDDLQEVREKVTIGPHETCIYTTQMWDTYYGVWYKVYASHPRTGRQRVIDGVLDFYKPMTYQVTTTLLPD